MRAISQGAARCVDARAARGADARRGPRRGRAAAGASRLIGAIVAGGASRRFGGEPKGLRDVGGARIVDRVVRALRDAVSEIVLLSNEADASRWLPDIRVVADLRAERGSLVGIHTALSVARESVFVVAWDMPFVSSTLVELIQRRSMGAEFATVPCSNGGAQPFCGIYTPACLPYVEQAIEASDLRVLKLLERLPRVTYVSAEDVSVVGDPERLFFNVNDAADLVRARQMVGE